MSSDLDIFRNEYLSRQETYKEIESIALTKLELAIKEEGVTCEIQSRVKKIDSFLKKILRKKYVSPFTEIKDQLGLRVIVIYDTDTVKINEIIHREFKVHHSEDKLSSLAHNELGYLGIHFEVSLPESHDVAKRAYNDWVFEIQLHTKAQNLWASVSHHLSYKSCESPPPQIQRAIYRLVALVEIFDREVSNAEEVISNQPNFPAAKLLKELEKKFYMFAYGEFDREFSIQNISKLQDLLNPEEINNFEALIGDFVKRNNDKLEQLFSDYSRAERQSYKILMLFQPESLMIFERLEKDRFTLLDLWSKFLPVELLEFLAIVWGISLPSG